jgi:hypothetical protein
VTEYIVSPRNHCHSRWSPGWPCIIKGLQYLRSLSNICYLFYYIQKFPYVILLVQRGVCRYQRGNQNPHIEEEQTTQWTKEKVQKDKQRSTKHIYKSNDRVTRTPLNTGGELRCSGRVGRFCSTSDIRRINVVTNPVISHERWK